MSLATPTTQQTTDQIVGQLEGALSDSFPLFPKAFSRVLAKALSGVWMLLYKYQGWLALQVYARFATYDEVTINGKVLRPLLELGRAWGVPDREDPTRAVHTISVPVTTQTGTLPINSQLTHVESGVGYITLTAVDLDSSSVSVDVQAVSDNVGTSGFGEIGNRANGDELEFVSPVDNVQRVTTITDVVSAGSAGESIDSYRLRVEQRRTAPPQGGAHSDYRLWCEEHPDIVHAYPYASDIAGVIDVYLEATVASSGSADGIPTAGQLADVKASHVDVDVGGVASRRPVSDPVRILPITRTSIDVEVVGLSAEDPPLVKSKIEEAIAEYTAAAEPYIGGLSVFPRKDRLERAGVSGAVSAVVNAYGGSVVDVRIKASGGSEILSVQLQPGEKAKAGAVTYPGSS